MAYAQIDICEVGPPEYPLITVLRDTIFQEHGHVFRTPFEDMIKDRQDVICLMAHLEGNPVGYKVGYRDRPGTYYSYSGGVLKDYRNLRIGHRLQHWQHAQIRARGYKSVYFSTFNKFRQMIKFGLSTGFVPVGVEERPEGELSFKFTKDLTLTEPARRSALPRATVHIESVAPVYHGAIADISSRCGLPAAESEIDQAMSHPGAVALLAFLDRMPIGFALTHTTQESAELWRIGVLPDWQSQGIAAALLAHLNKSKSQMSVPHSNIAMLKCAINAGFDITGLSHHHNQPAMILLQNPF